jgi:hypothetical protein
MNYTKVIITSALFLYSFRASSVELDSRGHIYQRIDNARNLDKSRQYSLDRLNNNLRYKVSYKRVKENFIEKNSGHDTYEISDDCIGSSSAEGCAASNSMAIGTTDSYIGEYSMYAVIGTGIKLPEAQIESYDGLDD